MFTLALLLTIHFVADFIFQSNWMALNKSKSWKALFWHVFVYAWTFKATVWLIWGPPPTPGWIDWFFVLTFATHFITDALTSRLTSKLWFIDGTYSTNGITGKPFIRDATFDDSKRHWFFVAIGFDQLIHVWTLAATWWWVYGG